MSEPVSQIININSKASPAVLASLLGINVSMIYQGRQDGKLPPNADATYRECIAYYCNYWKVKSSSKVSNVGEAALLQKIKLDAAKTEDQWLSIKQKRMELLDVNILAETFEPVFLHIRAQLVTIARKFPDIESHIDKTLDDLYRLGESVFKKASEELDTFIDIKLNEEVAIESNSEENGIPLNSFDDYISPIASDELF